LYTLVGVNTSVVCALIVSSVAFLVVSATLVVSLVFKSGKFNLFT